MRLPFAPPLAPMLSSAADALPGGEGWQFEPKWDGFRTLVFRDGDEILLQSRDEKPMNRYFPELIAPLAAMLSECCVIDGEIVIVGLTAYASGNAAEAQTKFEEARSNWNKVAPVISAREAREAQLLFDSLDKKLKDGAPPAQVKSTVSGMLGELREDIARELR